MRRTSTRGSRCTSPAAPPSSRPVASSSRMICASSPRSSWASPSRSAPTPWTSGGRLGSGSEGARPPTSTSCCARTACSARGASGDDQPPSSSTPSSSPASRASPGRTTPWPACRECQLPQPHLLFLMLINNLTLVLVPHRRHRRRHRLDHRHRRHRDPCPAPGRLQPSGHLRPRQAARQGARAATRGKVASGTTKSARAARLASCVRSVSEQLLAWQVRLAWLQLPPLRLRHQHLLPRHRQHTHRRLHRLLRPCRLSNQALLLPQSPVLLLLALLSHQLECADQFLKMAPRLRPGAGARETPTAMR